MKKATRINPAALPTSGAKVERKKDISKVLEFFRYKIATSLDCARATGILRNSVTWYIAYLEDTGMLQALYKAKDHTTKHMAKHYTADQRLWKESKELSLFGEGGVQ